MQWNAMQCNRVEGDQSRRDGIAEFLLKEQISFRASLSTTLCIVCFYSRLCTRSYLCLLMVMVRVRMRVRVTDL